MTRKLLFDCLSILFRKMMKYWCTIEGRSSSFCVRACASCTCLRLLCRFSKSPQFPALSHSVVAPSRRPIKRPRTNVQSELCSKGPPHHGTFLSPLPFCSLHHSERQGSFLAHVDTHTHTHTHTNPFKQHAHARTHKRSAPYYSLINLQGVN